MEKVSEIKSNDFQTDKGLEIADLAYYKEQKTLLALDEDEGIFAFKLKFVYDEKIDVVDHWELIQREPCELMSLYGHNLYVVCDEIYKYNLRDWPKTS